MRFFKTAVLVAALFATTVIAGMEQLAAVLPSCALDCMMTSVSQSSCKTTDQACLCNDVHYTAVLQECVLANCTIRESLTTKNVTTSACGDPIRDRTKTVSYAGVAGGIIALCAFILRMWLDLDAVAFLIPLSALSVVLANTGLGKDMWTLPIDNITHILYVYFWDELLYLSILPLTKISICFFYLRIFPDRRFRTATYVVIALNVSYWIAFVLISVFQCRPLPGAWHRWYGEENYKCNHINAQGWSSAVLNMVLDIIVMALPLRQLYGLNLSMKRKSFVICMFSLGIFVTLVSILRLNSLIHFASTTNLTWDYVAIGYWSTIECDVGVICACLPAIRSLLRRISPRFFGDTEQAKSSSYAMNSRSRGTSVPVQNKSSDGPFYRFDDLDLSDEARLHHPQPV
ncbi:Extracellular membrane protein, CFEM domain [Penicillium roqueforti FM164]|uniref:Extracellular membrane protein, CFEM domain n=1 Tax=Penicillium roqueforti (strain FM164) TaxID=1365484 RepID=W6R3Q0_PENRF|nr:Extracellular membrane protein, CFEM domain [Penicillium roqueforti FM164]